MTELINFDRMLRKVKCECCKNEKWTKELLPTCAKCKHVMVTIIKSPLQSLFEREREK